MRIAQIYHIYPAVFGGVSKVVYDVARRLCKKGHEVVVFTTNACLNEKSSVMFKVDDKVKVYYFPTILRNFIGRDIPVTGFKFASYVKKMIGSFDVVHLHGYRTFQNIIVHHFARKCGVPYVLQAHGSLPRIMARQRLKWSYDVFFGYRLLRDASKVFALSRMEAQQYRGMGVPEEKIEVIPNGIDLSEYANVPPKGSFKEKFSIDDGEKIVLYLGRIHRIKGIDTLVRAFANIIEKLEDVRLVVVGPDDGYLGELKALIKGLKIGDNALILGPLYGRDKLEAYVDADVYALSSRYETFPMSVLEALACRTPVIVTENCGIGDYFRDKVGLIVKPDSKHFAEALLQMLLENEKRNIFRKNCNTVIEKFNISKTISKLEEVYYEVIKDLSIYP